MRQIYGILLLSIFSTTTPLASSQTTMGDAFNDGKSFKSKNDGIKTNINPTSLTNVPGQNATTTNNLSGMYGSDLIGAGNTKGAACAAYVPTSDEYKNQECETINYVSGNPSARPVYVINKTTDPLITSSKAIKTNPAVHTSGTSGLTGTYSACSTSTTNLPGKTTTERCLVGQDVTEESCLSPLVVTYTWQVYTGQAGADLTYGYCGGTDIRGDKLTLPGTNTYVTEPIACSVNSHGTGTEIIISAVDCLNVKTPHGYNASACSAAPNPSVFDPTRLPILACTSMPRTNDNCFTSNGTYTGKVIAPVFVDTVDDSACVSLKAKTVPIL
jgi:hypothetical protein